MLNLRKMPAYKFQDGMLWGSATAGHQIEGDNVNSQNWHYEQLHPDWYQEPSGKACNSWEMLPEDARLLKELGHNAYRFSIEWARIEPEKGHFDLKALDRYQHFLDLLGEAGILACVSLIHGTHPWWFEQEGGFRKEENLAYFEKYLNFLLPKIADKVGAWALINEFNLGNGVGKEELDVKVCRLKSHAVAYRVVRQYSNAPASSAHAYVIQEPVRPLDPMDRTMADLSDWVINEFFFHAVRTGEIVLPYRDMEYYPDLKGSSDVWMINYYHRGNIDSRKVNGRGRKMEFTGLQLCDIPFGQREFTPEAFMKGVSRITDKPIWITENGVCCDDDRFRIIYIMLQLEAMKHATMLYHADFRAYLHWSLLDNYEWGTYKPRFGLCDVDRTTFKRTPKPSAYFLKEIIEQNGFSGDLFSKYVPEFNDFTLYDIYQEIAKRQA